MAYYHGTHATPFAHPRPYLLLCIIVDVHPAKPIYATAALEPTFAQFVARTPTMVDARPPCGDPCDPVDHSPWFEAVVAVVWIGSCIGKPAIRFGCQYWGDHVTTYLIDPGTCRVVLIRLPSTLPPVSTSGRGS